MRPRFVIPIAIVVLILGQALPGQSTGPPVGQYTVSGADAKRVMETGGNVVDDYGSYIHATLSDAQAESLRSQGGVVTGLLTGISRGSYGLDDQIPPAQQAAPTTWLFVVEFRGPVKQLWLENVQEAGGTLIEYLPSFGYLVHASAVTANAIRDLREVVRVVPYHPAFKVSPAFGESGTFDATAIARRDGSLQLVVQQITLTGATLGSYTTTSSRHVIDFSGSRAHIEQVARIDDVLWIEPAMNRASMDLNKSSSLVQSGVEGLFSIHQQGIDGSTQRVLVCDNGLETIVNDSHTTRQVGWLRHEVFNETKPDPADAQLEFQAHLANPPLSLPTHRKILLYYAPVEGSTVYGDFTIPPPSAESVRSHGTRTTGIVGGDAAPYGNGNLLDGIAFGSKIFFCDVDIGNPLVRPWPNDAWNMIWPAYERGATVASFSVGADPYSSTYTEFARQMDDIVWENRNLTIARAIGNWGTQALQRPETVAKSVLSVGGTENQPCGNTCASDGNEEEVHNLSSRGPAADGRFKPNVVAPGMCVEAPKDGGSYSCGNGGTSYAAPAVAGAAALIRDYLHRGYYPTGSENSSNERKDNVSAALIRAMIMASGRDLTGVTNPNFPNPDEGWGRPLIERVLYFSNETNQSQRVLIKDEWESANATTGSTWVRNFRVNSAGEVRVFLAWSDYPGTVGAPLALVNDLDLRVGGPGCGGGILDPVCIGNAFGVGSNETAPGKEKLVDRLNVEEAVYLCKYIESTNACAVPTGNYSVRVNGFNVPTTGGQPFAVVITGDVEWI